MGDSSYFERGQIVSARLAGASVTKTATMLGISRATVSKVMLAYMIHGETKSKRKSGRKST
jgi:predicted transcriptional regulator